MIHNHYCCCMIQWENPNRPGHYITVLDVQVFPNPNKDSTATDKCIKRAQGLRRVFKATDEAFKHVNASQRNLHSIPADVPVTVTPTIQIQIVEPDWNQHRGG